MYPRTYYPDNDPVPYDWDGKTLPLMPVDEKGTNIGKKISIRLSAEGSDVVLEHDLINKGVWDVELAAYSLNDLVFLKQHSCKDGEIYPNMGCNAEFYTEPGFLEIE